MVLRSNYNIYDTTQEAWRAMYQAIEYAKKSVYWEVYTLIDDIEGNKFFDLLIQKVQENIDVKIIVDYWGSFRLSRKAILKLKRAGVDIQVFQRFKKSFRIFPGGFMSRTHRKILVVDEHIGFIGGVNVQKDMKDWDDIHIRLEGKVVRSLLRAFARSYIIAGGKRKDVKYLLKYKYRVKDDLVDIIYDYSGKNYSKARKKYVEALTKAREKVILFSPYYFPDKKLLHAMWKARKRGIKIDLLIPFRTDLRVATYAAYAWFGIMGRMGIRVHALENMMHGKAMVVDDEWAMIGSSNLEHTSFYHSDEVNVTLKDKKVIKRLQNIAKKWIKKSRDLDDLKWHKRGRIHKWKEWIAFILYSYWFSITMKKEYEDRSKYKLTPGKSHATKKLR